MDTIFMNSKNGETSDPHRVLLNLTDKIHLRSSDEYVALSNLMEQYRKIYTEITDLKYQLRHGMKSLNYLMNHILYQIFKIILNIS